MKKVLESSWNGGGGWTAEYLGVHRDLYRALTGAQLPTGIGLLVPGHESVLGVMEEGILEAVWFLEHITLAALRWINVPFFC